jgi:iron complex outermembrane receptor protein
VKPHKALAILSLSLAALIPSAAAAQTGSIVGTVTDKAGKPVSGVQVFVQGMNIGQLTGTDGKYILDKMPPGTYTIVTRHIITRTERSGACASIRRRRPH